MEAKELMIGDIVRLVYRVGTFVSKVNLENLIDNREWKMEYEPIPLTAEILEKNGFVKVNSQRYRWGELCGSILFHVDANPVKGYFYITNESHANHANVYNGFYVHTLQHALRLCGLADLADNFTI